MKDFSTLVGDTSSLCRVLEATILILFADGIGCGMTDRGKDIRLQKNLLELLDRLGLVTQSGNPATRTSGLEDGIDITLNPTRYV